MSTFHGLEMAKQALSTQRSALYTTGHNISNVNTEGYSRQRVHFETARPYPSASRNRPQIAGQMGNGVEAGSIERIRNQFLDYQYRTENSKAGYWVEMSDAISRMERLMHEQSKNGLGSTMNQFRDSLQELSAHPTNSGARSVVVQRGLAVAETFNYLSESLNANRSDLQNKIGITVKGANSLLGQVNEINEQIKHLESSGYLANDLYDHRDRLLDGLSEIVNIKVTYHKSSENALDVADGVATIELVDAKGQPFTPPATLIDGQTGEVQTLSVYYSPDNQAVTSLQTGEKTIPIKQTTGSLAGIIESYGYMHKDKLEGIYPDMLANLDKLAATFATAFNGVHQEGYDLNENKGKALFEFKKGYGAAGSITVSREILDEPDLIAASIDENSGNGDNAASLANIFDEKLTSLGSNTTLNSFYESLIGDLGVRGQEAHRMAKNTEILRSQVDNQRLSVSSVSLDEEITNMVKYQHAYNAAARSMTTLDEMLDRIINNMGLVGR
ncbi:flagellar hook-associated protein FlgK [Virgibacillus alimentarius]|uniref:Flagellar hook-associated protein 1 n=1 Tax=Virgibacillus alimentarius TaxID=698769 RepID=A0ABS4S5L9_9BACI|nr:MULTISPECIES: flagellar hook-associated protein FlgK [Virgibacillus]MBP2256791.1 flagellar hook-associated protein 1 FlgK [Virgibacillus alimentarius]HLR65660.1 flagellar hook-associated protein FlgK [Virgibacillus sp.]